MLNLEGFNKNVKIKRVEIECFHQGFGKKNDHRKSFPGLYRRYINCDLGWTCETAFAKQIIFRFQWYLPWSHGLWCKETKARCEPLSTALWVLTAICPGDISGESKVEYSVFHPRSFTLHYWIQTSSTRTLSLRINVRRTSRTEQDVSVCIDGGAVISTSEVNICRTASRSRTSLQSNN